MAVQAQSVAFEAGALIVSWELTAPGFARLDVRDPARPGEVRRSQPRATPGFRFRETVAGLRPGGVYHYQIVAGPTIELDDATSTEPRSVQMPPEIRIGPVAVRAAPRSARVTWTTSRPTDSTVEYGRPGEVEARRTSPLAGVEHALELSGLEPGRSYQLVVVATDTEGAAPVTRSAPVSFTAPPETARAVTRIMPRQGPRTNTLAEISRDYLNRLRSLSTAEKRKLEDQLRAHAPAERIELSPEERAELAGPTDRTDAARFERRVDLVHRWIIHLGTQGKDISAFDRAAVTLSNRFYVDPAAAAAELDRTIAALADVK